MYIRLLGANSSTNLTNEEPFKRKNKRMKIAIISALTLLTILSCKETPTDLAKKWSNDIKVKILEDANIPVDSVAIDTNKPNIKYVTFFNKRIRTKDFGIRKSDGDTLIAIHYSKDQKFAIVKELCPGISRSFEGIKYRERYLGITELRFCDGKLKELGYNFNGKVGVWTEWNENGEIVKQTDYGLLERLKDLDRIKYYR
jgi:hypothetical protein